MKRIIFAIMLLITLGGCDGFGMLHRYPWYKFETWYCSEIRMRIEFVVDEKGDLSEAPVGYIEYEDYTQSCLLSFQGSTIWFCLEPDGQNVSEPLLVGSWKIQKDNLVITIDDDQLFEGRYSELLFAPCKDASQ